MAAAFALAACGGDAGGQAASESAAAPAANPCAPAANPCAPAANPCAPAANPCAANPCATGGQELPEGVTAEMVKAGKGLFAGDAMCVMCHGPDAKGLPNLGANLTDAEWLHSDGSYDAIVKTIEDGVSAEASTSGVPMPPKGGSSIGDDQVRAVAAYVWTLSHGGS